jgi:hypothetical protein
MSDTAPVPVAGSLSAKIIRACPAHPSCPLDCPERSVEELGEIASFDNRPRRFTLKEGVSLCRRLFRM